MCKRTQEPVLKIGTTVHVDDWTGTVEKIGRGSVTLLLDNGKRLSVAHRVIEDAISEKTA